MKEASTLITIILLVLTTATLGYFTRQDMTESFYEWMIQGNTVQSTIAGLMAGFVLGGIDTLLLYLGIESFEKYFKHFPFGNSELNRIGYVSTLGVFFSAFISSFVERTIQQTTNIENYPIWAFAVGCLLGGLITVILSNVVIIMYRKFSNSKETLI